MEQSSTKTESGRRGIGASLRGVVSNTLGLLSVHFQLIGVELQEEMQHVAGLAVLGADQLKVN